jgi:hypothetical protein
VFDLAYVVPGADPNVAPSNITKALGIVLPDVAWWIGQTYGVFGWLDTSSPDFAAMTWMGLGAGTFALVVLGSRHRLRVVVTVGLGIVLWAAIPVALSVTAGREIGIHFWQGRYTMPFGQGILLALGVLGAGWQGRAPDLEKVLRAVSPAVAWLMWPVLGTLTLVWALHRYARGEWADWNLADLRWTPPGGTAGLVALVALHAVAAVALVRSLREEQPDSSGPTPGRDPGHAPEAAVGAGVGAAAAP